MTLAARPLRMYTAPVDHEALALEDVERQLADAALYWVSTGVGDDPHPRPVWGVWRDGRLLLTLGSPVLRRAVAEDPRVVVHPESATDVVVVSGRAAPDEDSAVIEAFVAAYDAKYDWTYDVAAYGPPLAVTPEEVVAWHAAGANGRDGFDRSGKWVAD